MVEMFVPIEFDNPRAKMVAERLRRIEEMGAEGGPGVPPGIFKGTVEVLKIEAMLVLAQEVSNLRQKIDEIGDRMLARE